MVRRSHYGNFANDSRLGDADIVTIDQWVKEGAKEGDPADLPPMPQYSDGWKIGKPDKVVDIGQDYKVVNRGTPDQYVYFTVDPHFTQDTWVKSVELRPGNRRVVHHAHVWLQERGAPAAQTAAKLTYKDEFGLEHVKANAPVVDNGCLQDNGGELPGNQGGIQQTGILGSYLPGKCFTVPKNVLLMSYVAHMHFRGKDMKFELQHTDGHREVLVFVPHYSFNWQQIYRVKEPVLAENGSRLIITAHFDNSENNKRIPDPKATIRWGEPSSSEMMDGWIECIDDVPGARDLSASLK